MYPSAQREMEAGGPEAHYQPWLQSKLELSLGSMRTYGLEGQKEGREEGVRMKVYV